MAASRVWLDKICADSNDVHKDLPCLPYYLGACKSLLVTCGATYMSRIWCVTELVAYLQLRGEPQNVVLQQLGQGAHNFSRFDVHKASCSASQDKEYMLAVAEESFGDLDAFNSEVRKLLGPLHARNS